MATETINPIINNLTNAINGLFGMKFAPQMVAGKVRRITVDAYAFSRHAEDGDARYLAEYWYERRGEYGVKVETRVYHNRAYRNQRRLAKKWGNDERS